MLWERGCSRATDVLVSLAEGPSGRADLAKRVAITSQVGSHKGGSGTRSGLLLAIAAGQAARNGLCRPPAMPTLTGAQDFAAMRSYLSTAAKHGRRPFDVLTELTSGN